MYQLKTISTRAASGFTLLLALLLFLSSDVQAKKIVCIAPAVGDATDGFLHSHEGYERSTQEAGDMIMLCADTACLRSCIDQVGNGDELVIVAHGYAQGAAFIWGTDTIWGFGNGAGQMKPSQGWSLKNNVKLRFCSCWSSNVHDPSGTHPPLVDDLAQEFGSTSSKKGYKDVAWAPACLVINCTTPGLSKSERDAKALEAYMILELSGFDWTSWPPHNRVPYDPNNNREKAESHVNAMLFPQSVYIDIIYKEPYNGKVPTGGFGILNGDIIVDLQYILGFGISQWMIQNHPHLPWVLADVPMLPVAGLYTSTAQSEFYVPEQDQPITIKNIKLFDIVNQVPLTPAPGMVATNSISASMEISFDGGHYYESMEATGLLDLEITEYEAGQPDDTLVFTCTPLDLTLTGLPPYENIQLNFNPASEKWGAGALNTNGEPIVAMSFGGMLDLTYDGFGPYSSGMPGQFILSCVSPESGCTDDTAINFNPCAVADDGSCESAKYGCTYPTATNYEEDAVIEDGSCLFDEENCPGDFNGDNIRNTADMLTFLSLFGYTCD